MVGADRLAAALAVTSEGLASDVIVTLCFRRERQRRKVCDGREAEFVLYDLGDAPCR